MNFSSDFALNQEATMGRDHKIIIEALKIKPRSLTCSDRHGSLPILDSLHTQTTLDHEPTPVYTYLDQMKSQNECHMDWARDQCHMDWARDQCHMRSPTIIPVLYKASTQSAPLAFNVAVLHKESIMLGHHVAFRQPCAIHIFRLQRPRAR